MGRRTLPRLVERLDQLSPAWDERAIDDGEEAGRPMQTQLLIGGQWVEVGCRHSSVRKAHTFDRVKYISGGGSVWNRESHGSGLGAGRRVSAIRRACSRYAAANRAADFSAPTTALEVMTGGSASDSMSRRNYGRDDFRIGEVVAWVFANDPEFRGFRIK